MCSSGSCASAARPATTPPPRVCSCVTVLTEVWLPALLRPCSGDSLPLVLAESDLAEPGTRAGAAGSCDIQGLTQHFPELLSTPAPLPRPCRGGFSLQLTFTPGLPSPPCATSSAPLPAAELPAAKLPSSDLPVSGSIRGAAPALLLTASYPIPPPLPPSPDRAIQPWLRTEERWDLLPAPESRWMTVTETTRCCPHLPVCRTEIACTGWGVVTFFTLALSRMVPKPQQPFSPPPRGL